MDLEPVAPELEKTVAVSESTVEHVAAVHGSQITTDSSSKDVSPESNDSSSSSPSMSIESTLLINSTIQTVESLDTKKKVLCRYCKKEFSSSSNRKRHERLMHEEVHQKKENVQCVYCDKVLSSQSQLRNHSIICTGPSSSSAVNANSIIIPTSYNTHHYIESHAVATEDVVNHHHHSIQTSNNDIINTNSTTNPNHNINNNTNIIDHSSLSSLDQSSNSEDATESEGEEENEEQDDSNNVDSQERVPPVSKVDFDIMCSPFMEWLAEPATTPYEATVKQKRMVSKTQTQPIEFNLKFMIGLMRVHKIMDASVRTMAIFMRLDICRKLHDQLVQRKMGPQRVFTLFLLVKKILVYLVSMQSKRSRTMAVPQSIESYQYVESICKETTTLRKQSANNRKMGLEGQDNSIYTGRRKQIAALTVQEMKTIGKETMYWLEEMCKNTTSITKATAAKFAAYLVTVTLVLGLAPRSQVLRQLALNSTFTLNADTKCYTITMAAHRSKSGKASVIPLDARLSRVYSVYIQLVRPILLGKEASRQHPLLFTKKDGVHARDEFSSWTKRVSKEIIGRRINAHAFRHAVVTAMYEAGSSQAQMDSLANIMQHDPTVARDYYFRPQFEVAAQNASNTLSTLVFGTDGIASKATEKRKSPEKNIEETEQIEFVKSKKSKSSE